MYYLPGIFLFIIIFRAVRFFTTPLLKYIRFYKYYSPMFMTMPLWFNHYDIHLGTSWDLARLEKVNPRKVMEYISEGLYKIALEIEAGRISSRAKFRGNTFYLKEVTVKRFNFRTRRMNVPELVLFAVNYIELCLLNSIIRRKFFLIPLNNVMIVYFDAADIVNNKKIFKEFMETARGINKTPGTKHPSTIRPAKRKVRAMND
jgi:hypothetical protein